MLYALPPRLSCFCFMYKGLTLWEQRFHGRIGVRRQVETKPE